IVFYSLWRKTGLRLRRSAATRSVDRCWFARSIRNGADAASVDAGAGDGGDSGVDYEIRGSVGRCALCAMAQRTSGPAQSDLSRQRIAALHRYAPATDVACLQLVLGSLDSNQGPTSVDGVRRSRRD